MGKFLSVVFLRTEADVLYYKVKKFITQPQLATKVGSLKWRRYKVYSPLDSHVKVK